MFGRSFYFSLVIRAVPPRTVVLALRTDVEERPRCRDEPVDTYSLLCSSEDRRRHLRRRHDGGEG